MTEEAGFHFCWPKDYSNFNFTVILSKQVCTLKLGLSVSLQITSFSPFIDTFSSH
jgi:hypothetical protein